MEELSHGSLRLLALLIKRYSSLLLDLLDLFTACWDSGTVPSSWKRAVIRLIPKAAAAEDSCKPSNIHPIALT